ncbi:MAG: glycosyltransferase [Chloroflexota bacterium]|nr:glycosyltransferase [Chloroflexota bacterium]
MSDKPTFAACHLIYELPGCLRRRPPPRRPGTLRRKPELPIVATAVDGNAEAVTDSVNGLLAPPGDPQAFAAALLRLLDDPSLRKKMGQSGLTRADEFGARKMVRDIAALYEKLLTEHTSP